MAAKKTSALAKARAAIKEIYEAKPAQLPVPKGKHDNSGSKRLSRNRRKR